jgi:PAS domain S-box-containing protein/putative nucleotidyltransferase with HDIG domain
MVDVSSDKEKADALEISEERYRELVEKGRIAILVDDEQGNIKYFNERYAEIFGYSVEDMKKQTIWLTVHPDDLEKLKTFHTGRLQGKDVPSRYEYKGVRKDGSVIYLDVEVVVLKEGERPIGTHSYIWDITDRKRTEEVIEKRRTQLELIHHVQSEIPMDTGLETILIRAAESIGKTFGYYKISVNLYDRKTEEIEYLTGWNKTGLPLPRGHRQKLGQGLIGKAARLKQTIVANDVFKEADYLAYHLTETRAELIIPLLVQDHLLGVLDLQATETGAFSKEDVAVLQAIANYISYIIDNKRREETLREERDRAQKSESRYRALFECANDAIFLLDVEGKHAMVNQKAADMLGYEIEELLGMTYLDIVAPSQYRDTKSKIKAMLEDRASSPFERIFRKKNGAEFPVEINISTIRDEQGKPLYVQRIVRDITERKLAENELRRFSAKLRQALESIIKVVASTVEQRDPYTAGHQYRVAELARSIALELELSVDHVESVSMAGVIHDIGKISVPAEILSKPSKLNEVEFALIREHARIGYEILREVEFPWPIALIVYQHHERLNGSGYPQGLRGEDILLEARILGVADAVEAMASHRPYRPAHGIERALEEISTNRGTLYDPRVVDACLKISSMKGFSLNSPGTEQTQRSPGKFPGHWFRIKDSP